jgi:hypothetical protein
LRRSRNSVNFSPQSENIKVKSSGYAEDFPQRVHILAVCGAKIATVRPDQAQNAVQGLPLDGAAAPYTQSEKFAPSATLYSASTQKIPIRNLW